MDLRGSLGVPVDAGLYRLALTHRSYAYENGRLPTNERLEFLGDSVLGLVVSDRLYTAYPELPEGHLARLRAAVVNGRALAEVARSLGVGDHVLLGRGEESTGGRDRVSILADTMEALLGAVFVGSGFVAAQTLVRRLFDPLIDTAATVGAGLDWKTSLQEFTARDGLGPPEYRLTGSGPAHDRSFLAEVSVGGEVRGTGTGTSKKVAEQVAARQAWEHLDALVPGDAPVPAGVGVPGGVPGPDPAPARPGA